MFFRCVVIIARNVNILRSSLSVSESLCVRARARALRVAKCPAYLTERAHIKPNTVTVSFQSTTFPRVTGLSLKP